MKKYKSNIEIPKRPVHFAHIRGADSESSSSFELDEDDTERIETNESNVRSIDISKLNSQISHPNSSIYSGGNKTKSIEHGGSSHLLDLIRKKNEVEKTKSTISNNSNKSHLMELIQKKNELEKR